MQRSKEPERLYNVLKNIQSMKLLYLLLIGTLFLCSSGIACAANTTTIYLYDEDNKESVIETIDRANAGDVFAMLDLISKLGLVAAGAILLLVLLYARIFGKPELYKFAITSLIIIMGACMLVQIYYGFIEGMAPSIQVIEF